MQRTVLLSANGIKEAIFPNSDMGKLLEPFVPITEISRVDVYERII